MISASEAVGTPETTTKNYSVTIANTGKGTLKIESLDLTGTDANEFTLKGVENYDTEEVSLDALSLLSAKPDKDKKNKKAKVIKVRKNSSITFNVAFNPTSKGIKRAKIQVKSSKNSLKEVELIGLATVYEDFDSVIAVIDSLKDVTVLARKAAAAAPERKETNGLLRSMQVYPNPSSGEHVKIALSNFGKQEKVQVTMHDVSGRTVKTMQIVTDQNGAATTELKAEPSRTRGLYIIKAQAPSGSEQMKLIIE